MKTLNKINSLKTRIGLVFLLLILSENLFSQTPPPFIIDNNFPGEITIDNEAFWFDYNADGLLMFLPLIMILVIDFTSTSEPTLILPIYLLFIILLMDL